MREDFEALHSRLTSKDFDGILTKAEYAKLMIGAYVIANNLRDKIKLLKKSVQGYEEDLIPRLQKIIDAPDDQYLLVAEENLTLENNN